MMLLERAYVCGSCCCCYHTGCINGYCWSSIAQAGASLSCMCIYQHDWKHNRHAMKIHKHNQKSYSHKIHLTTTRKGKPSASSHASHTHTRESKDCASCFGYIYYAGFSNYTLSSLRITARSIVGTDENTAQSRSKHVADTKLATPRNIYARCIGTHTHETHGAFRDQHTQTHTYSQLIYIHARSQAAQDGPKCAFWKSARPKVWEPKTHTQYARFNVLRIYVFFFCSGCICCILYFSQFGFI